MDDYEIKFPTKSVQVLSRYDTVYSSDSVEWCPIKNFEHIFSCGNYQLEEDKPNCGSDAPRERFGRILLFSFKEELILQQTIDTEAVLDQKWCHNAINNEPILGVVNANKTLQVYKLNSVTITLDLITSYKIKDDESETLILSLDWNTGKYPNNSPEIICSDSKGNVHIFSFNSNELKLINSWHAHEFQAWISAFYYWDTRILFTGGDDSMFCKFDTRVGVEPVAKNRSHEAGVTCLHSNVDKEFLIASGSYDGFLRLWDIRKLKTPMSCLQVPGTLWRLKWNPLNTNYLLSACMLGGVHIIDSTVPTQLKIVESFYEHKNIAYGADWSYLKKSNSAIIGTSSFYDHLLCVSKVVFDELSNN